MRGGLLFLILVVLACALPRTAAAQETTDAAAVAEAMLARLLDDSSWWSEEPDAGAPPLLHPNGDPVAFCTTVALDAPGGADLEPVPPSLAERVRARVADVWDLRPSERCRFEPDPQSSLRGVVDERRRPAVIVALGVRFDAATRATAHFGIVNGGLGAWGATCSFEKRGRTGWAAVPDSCLFYDG